jgi:Rieske Fe-S protein
MTEHHANDPAHEPAIADANVESQMRARARTPEPAATGAHAAEPAPSTAPARTPEPAATGARAAEPNPVRPASPLRVPMCRRRALLVIGGTVAAAGALPAFLAACSGEPAPTAWVATDATAADLDPGAPVEVPFAGTTAAGDDLIGVAWLVAQADGSIVAFDPRCTHQACEYAWAEGPGRFECACHEAAFTVDGDVLYGPPPRPLTRFDVRVSGGAIELAVPEDYKAPLPGD